MYYIKKDTGLPYRNRHFLVYYIGYRPRAHPRSQSVDYSVRDKKYAVFSHSEAFLQPLGCAYDDSKLCHC